MIPFHNEDIENSNPQNDYKRIDKGVTLHCISLPPVKSRMKSRLNPVIDVVRQLQEVEDFAGEEYFASF